MFQYFNLIPTLTARENVQLVGELVGAGANDAAEALEAVGLTDRADRFPSLLSGGEQQRVAIARALAGEPRFLLADEPTGNLDTHMADSVLDLLSEINDKGVTIIMVTHEPDMAEYADRLVKFVDGVVQEDGKTARVA